ncbi:MAG TPA: L-histidine N(alpha)-methyltransferase [Pseudomonadales bacterium]
MTHSVRPSTSTRVIDKRSHPFLAEDGHEFFDAPERDSHAEVQRERFARDVLAGFSAAQKFLQSKYFYDARGSKLFERITETHDYYVTGCEFDVLERCGADIVDSLEADALDVVELGAGDGRKTKVLLTSLLEAGRDVNYMPVDISETAVSRLVRSVRASHRAARVNGFAGEYFDCLRTLAPQPGRRRLVLFLGSTIGNMDHPSAMAFLRTLGQHLSDGDYVLIGFDLKKDIDVLMAAYNDSEGVTREFNFNVLRRINRELGGRISVDKFTHYGFYNPIKGAMESYLISLEEQDVAIDALHRRFHFDPYEGIHLEQSTKYLEKDLPGMANAAGFDSVAQWRCARGWFVDALWRVKKPDDRTE